MKEKEREDPSQVVSVFKKLRQKDSYLKASLGCMETWQRGRAARQPGEALVVLMPEPKRI